MDQFIPFARPDLGTEESAAVNDVLSSGWLTSGPKVKEFEDDFSSITGAEFTIAVNSCTAALHLSLEAVQMGTDDEVITSPYSFASTSEVIRYFGGHPVFVDIDADSFNIDVKQIESAITARTKAIMPIHIAGLPAQVDEIYRIASKYDLPVIEDAAHAFPATYKDYTIGERSDFACFSFYPTKPITTGEGGMICTSHSVWADRCRTMALHGVSTDAWNRYSQGGKWHYEITAPGFKYNMTDIAAAMGIVQLKRAFEMRARREEIALAYLQELSEFDEIQLPSINEESLHAWHLFMLRVLPSPTGFNRDRLHSDLTELGIGTSVHFIPIHMHSYYRDLYGYEPNDFPVAYREFQRELSIPIYSSMTDSEVDRVLNAIKSSIASAHSRSFVATG